MTLPCRVSTSIDQLPAQNRAAIMALGDWPRPDVALAPWDKAVAWHWLHPAKRIKNPPTTLKSSVMQFRALGKTGLIVSAIGYGALKIGRNQGMKYPQAFDLPDEADAGRLLNTCLDLGINYIDTARAYGLSEERIGKAIAHRRREYVLSSKAGEIFENGQSRYDYSPAALRASVETSLKLLNAEAIDVLFIHTKDDLHVQNHTDAVPTFQAMKAAGLVRYIGLSAKTPVGAEQALTWADALMVEYNSEDRGPLSQ